jgi:hypothetical protein
VRPGRLSEAPPSYSKPEIPFRERVKKALAWVREHADRDLRQLDLSGLSVDERDFVLKTAHLPEDVDLNLYCEAWLRFRRMFAMPRLRGYVGDLAVMLGQPEMLACLLGAWPNPPDSSSGPRSAYPGSKAVMLLMGALGMSPHVDDAFEYLKENPAAQEVVAWALAESAELAGDQPTPFRLAGSVDSVLRHFPKLAATLGRRAMEANVRMLRSLAALYPNLPICKIAGIDGTAVLAWVKQKSGKTKDEEALLRGRASHAGFRFYEQKGNEKRDVAEGEKVNVKRVKCWRGYYLVVLVDYCTGRPIVWTLVDASWTEARTLHELLRVLYELWPDCPMKTIVGDGAWDKDEWHELCERHYGLHLVASRTSDPRKLDAKHRLPERESELIDYFDGRGQVFCRAHNKPLSYLGNGFPKRNDLAPGEAAPEAQFRLRFRCEGGCGTPSLQMKRHWTALAYYPHTPTGQRKRYAERHALLAHRNVCESLFNALKVGHGIATCGADRLRLNDLDTVHALVDLSFCMGTALLLGQERDKLGVGYTTPWNGAVAA